MKSKPLSMTVRSVVFFVVSFLFCQVFAAASSEVLLHNFVDWRRGAFPAPVLIADGEGNLYGATYNGGVYGAGVIFRLQRDASGKWQEKVLHNFTGRNDGFGPNSLTIDSSGHLFGTASQGGSNSYGVVFELSPAAHDSWTEKVLHSFAGPSGDGYFPAGILLDSSGNLYGTASGGINNTKACGGYCGIVFRLQHSGTGWVESSIYEFTGQQDAGIPAAGISLDAAGNLYGATTPSLIPWTIFRLTPASSGMWTEITLFTMSDSSSQGLFPRGVILDAAGNLFGATWFGGPSNNGLVFELLRGSGDQWNQKVLHNFAGGSDGAEPLSTPRFDAAGNLYGTTFAGNGSVCPYSLEVGCGTVYRLTANTDGTWSETVLHGFTGGADGASPEGQVIVDPTGSLFGTTHQGGSANAGAIFELIPAPAGYSESVLYTFPTTDGARILAGLVSDVTGNLYGTAFTGGLTQCKYETFFVGCGVVFKLTRLANGTWYRTVLHNFTGQGNDGAFPEAGLILDSAGNLYGTTNGGGDKGFGTVFQISHTAGKWKYSTLYSFGATFKDGQSPASGLLLDDFGNLYGTTAFGGSPAFGTVFKLSPTGGSTWTESILYNFFGPGDAAYPYAGLVRDSAGNLYGTTSNSFPSNPTGGSVFRLSPNSSGMWTETILYTFNPVGINGFGQPSGLILDSSGNLYGTTQNGGPGNTPCFNGCGVVYKLTTASSGPWTETVLYAFTAENGDGAFPTAGLSFDAIGNLYGTTSQGGGVCRTTFANNCGGTVFKLTPSSGGWTETILHGFPGGFRDGAIPMAPVILDGVGNIYGTTSTGGTDSYFAFSGGTAFQITP